ncbi:MAG: hypothetical protein ACOZCO_05350 [Bacteroidota bacterium]
MISFPIWAKKDYPVFLQVYDYTELVITRNSGSPGITNYYGTPFYGFDSNDTFKIYVHPGQGVCITGQQSGCSSLSFSVNYNGTPIIGSVPYNAIVYNEGVYKAYAEGCPNSNILSGIWVYFEIVFEEADTSEVELPQDPAGNNTPVFESRPITVISNPFSEQLQITGCFPEGISEIIISIHSLEGKLVYHHLLKEIKGDLLHFVPCTNWESGVYLLTIIEESKKTTLTLIKSG